MLEPRGILSKMFFDANFRYEGFRKSKFKNLLKLSLKNSSFKYANNLYEQIDGLAMGSSLFPAVDNIFLHHLESVHLKSRSYLDETFILFKDETQAQIFFHLFYS